MGRETDFFDASGRLKRNRTVARFFGYMIGKLAWARLSEHSEVGVGGVEGANYQLGRSALPGCQLARLFVQCQRRVDGPVRRGAQA